MSQQIVSVHRDTGRIVSIRKRPADLANTQRLIKYLSKRHPNHDFMLGHVPNKGAIAR